MFTNLIYIQAIRSVCTVTPRDAYLAEFHVPQCITHVADEVRPFASSFNRLQEKIGPSSRTQPRRTDERLSRENFEQGDELGAVFQILEQIVNVMRRLVQG